jgi:hypothetical protein
MSEIIIDYEVKVIVPSGYMGSQGEIWFARIMPEPFVKLNYGYSVVFTTPYIISEMRNGRFVSSNEKSWNLFLSRPHSDENSERF